MEKLLKFLSGKKSIIVAILGIVITWAFASGYITEQTATSAGSILAIIAGVASYKTKNIYSKK